MTALRFDPAGLELTPSQETFTAFTDGIDTLSLANLTDRLGTTYGDRTAFVLEAPLDLPGASGTTVSFAALASLVRRTTAALAGLGVARGDRVVLCTRNRMELAVAEWAVVRAGAVAVPVGARLAVHRRRLSCAGGVARRNDGDGPPGARVARQHAR